MKIFPVLLAIISNVGAFAQPVVTRGNFPVDGSVLNYYLGSSKSKMELPAGENQVWDLSELSPSFIDSVRYTDAAFTKNKSLFPASTIALEAPIGLGNFTYLNISGDEVEYLGFVTNDDNKVVGKYSDTWLMYSLPLRYNDEGQDDFASTSKIITAGDTSDNYYSAHYTYSVDGYGTLITPFKSYENSLRIKSVITGRDSSVNYGLMDTTMVNYYTTEKISWISSESGNVFEQASTYNFSDFFLQESSSRILDIRTLVKKGSSLSVYPDPASSYITLACSGTGIDPIVVNIIGSLGIVEKTFSLSSGSMNNFKCDLKISDLRPGLYYVQMLGKGIEWKGGFVKN